MALDQAFLCNRLGAAMPQGMIFALKRDVVSSQNPQEMPSAGCVTLRPGKRARPIVLRANVGDCLEITFTNLLCPIPRFFTPPVEQPVTREAGVHVAGLELVGAINSDASYVGLNLNSLTPRAPRRAGRASRKSTASSPAGRGPSCSPAPRPTSPPAWTPASSPRDSSAR